MPTVRALALGLLAAVALCPAEEAPHGEGEGEGAVVDAAAQHAAHEQEAAALIAAAERAEAAGRFAEAEDLFERATLVAGDDPRAHRGLVRVREALAGGDGTGPDLGVAHSVRRQLAEVEVRVALERARRLAADGRPEDAREAAASAAFYIERFPDLHAAEAMPEIQALIEEMAAATAAEARAEGRVERAEAQADAHGRARQELELEGSRFDARLARIIALKQRRHYELALAMARELVSDHPGNPRAEALFGDLLRRAHEQRKLTTEERMLELKKEVSERIRRSMIPEGFDGRPRFPEDWFEVQDRRVSAWDEEVQMPEWELALRDRLAGRVDVDLVDVEVAQAFESLAHRHGINLVIDPDLRAAGGSAPVNLSVRGMRLDNVFGWLARQAGTSWILRNEAVWVGGEVAREPVTSAYDVAEFVFRPTDFEALGLALFALDGAGDGGGFDLFGGGDAFGDEGEGIAPEEMVDLIQMAVAPEVWDNPDYGINIRGHWLIISAPSETHLLVQEFLRSQARANSTVVRLRLHWLEINDNYVEEIGVDWSSPNNSVLQSPFAQGIVHFEPEAGYTGSLVNQLPAPAVNLGQAATGTGLQLQYVNLAIPALSAIMSASERKQKARLLDGIELTSLNGVQSSAFFGEQVAYISDYEVSASSNYDPVIEVLNVGQSIAIKPFVSANRKYVTLDLQPTIATVTFFTETIVAQRVFNAGGGGGGVVFTNTFPLELPNLLVKSAGTRVMIPDGGTVLVGGFGRHIDQSSETQVPILGHIPFLGRLFGMRGRYSTKSQLYLTVNARIILYDEEEANL